MNGCRRLLRAKRRGQALIYISIVMTTLLAFALVVADAGLMFSYRRAMQNAVDAAALAGAQNLPADPNNDTTGARPIACDYATVKNAVSGMTVDCSDQGPDGSGGCAPSVNPTIDILVCQTYVVNDSVRVTAHKVFQPLQLPGFGWLSVNIETQATAVVGSVHSACIAPLFQTVDLLHASGVWGSSGVILNTPTIMKTSSSNNQSGNFLALQVNGSSSANNFSNAIGTPSNCIGPNAPQTSGSATTNTGNMYGPFDSGMKQRQSAWQQQAQQPPPAPPGCPNANAEVYAHSDGTLWNGNVLLTPATCYRMVVIPLLSGNSANYSGTTTANILGFLTFYISNWCGQSSTPKLGSGSSQQTCAPPQGTTLPQLNRGELWGYYVSYMAAGDADFQPYDGYGTKIVALIQ